MDSLFPYAIYGIISQLLCQPKHDRKHIMSPYYLPVLANIISVPLAIVLINDMLMLVLLLVIIVLIY